MNTPRSKLRGVFICLAFGQLTFRESLRDLELGLRSRPEHLYHLGLRGRVCRSTEEYSFHIFAWTSSATAS